MDKKYWNDFYRQHKEDISISSHSSFSEFCNFYKRLALPCKGFARFRCLHILNHSARKNLKE